MTYASRPPMTLTTLALVLIASLLPMAGAKQAAAEEQTVNATAVWQGHGQLFRTGEDSATFVGSLIGILLVETSEGPVRSGEIVCPGMLDVSLTDGKQSGSGRCTITADDRARVFADWTCSGYHLVGCSGDFTLTAGTGRFAGISGGGPMVIRSDFRALAKDLEWNAIDEAATGVAFWRNLTYSIPAP